jgi:hypothetical protein
VLSETGRADQTWMKGAIEFTKKSLDVSAEVSPDQVFDFSFVERANR